MSSPLRRLGPVALLPLLLGAAAGGGLEDPTRPAVFERRAPRAPRPVPPPLVVTSVRISPERRFAVINGRRLTVGDRIAGARVIEIRLSSVRLRGRRGEIVLEVSGKPIKRPTEEEP